jgi:hypothetical protein
VSEKDKSFKKNMLGHTNNFRTICEVLREIYWGIDDPDIRLKVIEASTMAKKMSRRISRNKYKLSEALDYEEMSEEDKKTVSRERWNQYLEELAMGVDHPMKKEDE